jgi:hypothetical protein
MPRVIVLYEDSRAPGAKPFGPHRFVTQLASDRLEKGIEEVAKLVHANPRNGNSKLRTECQRNLEKLSNGPGTVIAVYDSDKVAKLVERPPAACRRDLIVELKRGCEPKESLTIVLLEENTETLLVELRRLEGGLVSDEEWRKAIDGKALNERDLIFTAASRRSKRELRAKLVAAVPSLGRLVDKIVNVAFPSSAETP